jgi:hypothetical protein
MSAGAAIGIMLFALLFGLIIYIAVAVCCMKIFKKAGHKNAWAAWVPIYSAWVYFEVAGRPGWWALLSLISPVNIVIGFIGGIDMAKSFGKDSTFGVIMLGFLPFIGIPMLAFGKAEYLGPAGPQGASVNAAPSPQMSVPEQPYQAPVAQQPAPQDQTYSQPPVAGPVPPTPVDEPESPTPPSGPLVQ